MSGIGKSFLAGSIALSLTAMGCSHLHSSAPNASTTASAAPAATSAVNSGAGSNAASLAQQTAQYAHDVSPLLDQPKSATSEALAAPSIVQWEKPHTAHDIPPSPAGVQPAPVTTTAAAAPVKEATPNRAASLASAKFDDDMSVPMILPESADRLPAPASAVAADSTDETEKKLQQMVRDYPRDLGNQLDYQLVRFVREERTPDLSSVTGLSSEDREIVSALMDGLNNFRNNARADGNLMLSRKIQPLLDMADRLRSEAELAIPTVALCTRVDSFGVYRPRPARFGAGKENEVIIYCEVANFTSVQDEQKMWQTRLKQEMVLYTDSGLAVWPEKSNGQLFVDSARNRRHDFFIPRKITLPATLTIGRYLLKITLTDESSNRVAEATTPIEIVAE